MHPNAVSLVRLGVEVSRRLLLTPIKQPTQKRVWLDVFHSESPMHLPGAHADGISYWHSKVLRHFPQSFSSGVRARRTKPHAIPSMTILLLYARKCFHKTRRHKAHWLADSRPGNM